MKPAFFRWLTSFWIGLILFIAVGALVVLGHSHLSAKPFSASQMGLAFDRARVTIFSEHTGTEAIFDVEVARTREQKAQGLMLRETVPQGTGMLFLFDPPEPATFWMKNTLVPLDLLFIDPEGTIVFIAAQAKPHDLTPLTPPMPVASVLEIGGGEAQRLGIVIGDSLFAKHL